MSIVFNDVEVVEKTTGGDDLCKLTFRSESISKGLEPGNFVHIRTSEDYDPLFRRAMSIHSAEGAFFSVFFRIIGKGTARLARMVRGDRADVVGPLGNTFKLPEGDEQVLMVAGGTGMPPLYFLAKRLLMTGGLKAEQITFLSGIGGKNDRWLTEDPTTLGVNCQISSDDGTIGHHGFVTELLMAQLNKLDIAGTRVYSCGPEAMMREVSRICMERDVRCQLSLEGDMPCGIGTCLGCVVQVRGQADEFKRICKDGPVFDNTEVEF